MHGGIKVQEDIFEDIFLGLLFWSGREIEPVNAKEKYARVNRILVEVFEGRLKELEAGALFSKEFNISPF